MTAPVSWKPEPEKIAMTSAWRAWFRSPAICPGDIHIASAYHRHYRASGESLYRRDPGVRRDLPMFP